MGLAVYKLMIHRLHPASGELTPVRRILESLWGEVERCGDRITRAEASKNEDFLEAVTDEECSMIEELLGLAFVTCQIEITRTVSALAKLHGAVKQATPKSVLATTSGIKKELLRFGNTKVKSSGFTKLEALDALANYVKHGDEWRGPWDKLPKKKRAYETVKILKGIGCKQFSTGNLRSASRALGLDKYNNLRTLEKILLQWRSALYHAYEQELESKGLLNTRGGKNSVSLPQ